MASQNHIICDIQPSQDNNRDYLLLKELMDQHRNDQLYRLFHTAVATDIAFDALLQENDYLLLGEGNFYLMKE